MKQLLIKRINTIILIIFIILSILIGSHHEPWADEAQSWLIARDASIGEIIWNIARYEGTFPLWFLILKLFIICGLQYKYLYMVSIFISSVGLWVFLNKTNLPIYIKILFPFNFYIFYQYNIVARSYSLLFLAFSFWLVTYKRRFSNPLKYISTLIFFSFISMHGMVISLGFALLFFVELFKKQKIKDNVKYIILICTIWLVEVIILLPSKDLYMSVLALYNIKEMFIFIINEIFIINNFSSLIYNVICIFFIMWIFICNLRKNRDTCIVFCITFIFMIIVRVVSHHLGILFFIIMFGYLENFETQTKISKKIFVLILLFYSIFSIISSFNDIKWQYSGSKEMAQYLKTIEYEEKLIYAFGYHNVSVLPYFDKEIFDNWKDMTYYKWKITNKDLYDYTNFKKIDKSQFKDIEKPDYILVLDRKTFTTESIINYIESTGKYEIDYKTQGNMFFKDAYYEDDGFVLYKLKE